MQIIISNSSDTPIYEQIVTSIKQAILNGDLVGGEQLPSIRTLAKDLRISNITTKHAYEELEHAGFIEAIASKGYYVKRKSKEYRKEEILATLEQKLLEAIVIGKSYQMNQDEIQEIMKILLEEEYEK